MVKKFFLELDHSTPEEAYSKGKKALSFLRREYRDSFLKKSLGMKINKNVLTRRTHYYDRLRYFHDKYECAVFGDLKVVSDQDMVTTDMVHEDLHLDYITVSANLEPKILEDYVKILENNGIKTVGFVDKMSDVDASDKVYESSLVAQKAGCYSFFMESHMLREKRIQRLEIKKFAADIRVDQRDRPTRITAPDTAELISQIDYVVIWNTSKTTNFSWYVLRTCSGSYLPTNPQL